MGGLARLKVIAASAILGTGVTCLPIQQSEPVQKPDKGSTDISTC
jgi:hypothetical protein